MLQNQSKKNTLRELLQFLVIKIIKFVLSGSFPEFLKKLKGLSWHKSQVLLMSSFTAELTKSFCFPTWKF